MIEGEVNLNPEETKEFITTCSNFNMSEIGRLLDIGIPNDIINLGMHEIIEKSEDPNVSIECLELLYKYGANLEAVIEGNIQQFIGHTILGLAAVKQKDVIIEWLISKKINLNQMDDKGNTPLDLLISNKLDPTSNTVKILTNAGASLHTQDKFSNSNAFNTVH